MKDQKLRIAYILSLFPAFSETFIIREINQLRQKNVEAEVFSLKTPSPDPAMHENAKQLYQTTNYIPFIFSSKLLKATLKILFSRPRVIIGLLSKIIISNLDDPITLLKTLAIFPKSILISEKLKNMGITNIHAHWGTIPATSAWIVAAINSSDFTFTTHAWDIFKADNLFEHKIHASKSLITISEFNKKYILNKYKGVDPEEIKVLYLGIDLNQFNPQKTAKNQPFTILSIGRMVEKKGFHYLLEAVKILKDKNIPIKCQIIYVDGPYNNVIFDICRDLKLDDTVEFHKDIPQEKIVDYYNAADCFALPCVIAEDGDIDGIPTVILEALAMELPVVSTDISGIPEVVIDNETGLVVKPEDPKALTFALETLYRDKAERKRLGRKGRQLVNEKFSLSKNVDKLVDIIKGG